MANHMAEIAKMLGVELGEKFELKSIPGIPFKFTEDGLVCLGPAKIPRDVMNEAFVRMLTGCSEIKRRPWKPSYYEKYYSVGPGGVLEPATWLNDLDDLALFKLGNCYSSVSEAEANRDKWIVFYASDEVLEV